MSKPFRYGNTATQQTLCSYGARDRQMVNCWYIICQMVSAIKRNKARKGNRIREFAILTRVVREGTANKDGI